MIGVVKWYSHEKGFGFIMGQDGRKYYFRGDGRPVGSGDIATFLPCEDNRGWRAREIVLVADYTDIERLEKYQLNRVKPTVKVPARYRTRNMVLIAVFSAILLAFAIAAFLSYDSHAPYLNVLPISSLPAMVLGVLAFQIQKTLKDNHQSAVLSNLTPYQAEKASEDNGWLNELPSEDNSSSTFDWYHDLVFDPINSSLACNIHNSGE